MTAKDPILTKAEALWREGRYLEARHTLDDLDPEDFCEPDTILGRCG